MNIQNRAKYSREILFEHFCYPMFVAKSDAIDGEKGVYVPDVVKFHSFALHNLTKPDPKLTQFVI